MAVTVASSSSVMVQLSPAGTQGPRHRASRQCDKIVKGFDVLKSSWILLPTGMSAAQVKGQLRAVPCADTVLNPEPSNGSPSSSNATAIRRVSEATGGGRGGTLRAKLMPTVRSRSTATEHCVPSHPEIDQPDTVESSAGSATRTTGDWPAPTGPEQRDPHWIGPPLMLPCPSPATWTESMNCFAVSGGAGAFFELVPHAKNAHSATEQPSMCPLLPLVTRRRTPPPTTRTAMRNSPHGGSWGRWSRGASVREDERFPIFRAAAISS